MMLATPQVWPSTARAWWAVFVLLLCYLMSFVDRNILSLLVAPIRHDLGVSDTEMGLLLGPVFAFFYVLLGLPFGWLVDRRNRRNIIAGGLALWSLMTVLAGLAANFGELAAARVGLAVGEAGLMPAAFSLLGDYFPPERRGRAVGIFGVGGFTGIGGAYVAGGAILHVFAGVSQVSLPVFGTVALWQATLILVGLATSGLAVLMLSVMEVPRAGGPVTVPVGAPAGGNTTIFAYIGSNKRTFTTIYFAYTCVALIAFGWFAWLPSYFIRQFAMIPANAGLAIGSITTVAGVVGSVIGGILADRLTARGTVGGKFSIILIIWLGWIPATLGLLVSENLGVSLACVALFMFVDGIGLIQFGAVIQDMTPARLRGRAVAIWYLVTNIIGNGLGPVLIPLASDHLFSGPGATRYAMVLVTLPVLLIGLTLSLIGRRPYDVTRAALTVAAAPATRARVQEAT